MTELDLSLNQQLASLPFWLQQGLSKLKRVNLRGCAESFDFGALSTFLNGSVVTEVDLSSCYSLISSPDVVFTFIRNTKAIKRLRLAQKSQKKSITFKSLTVLYHANRILGQPVFTHNTSFEGKGVKDTKKALNDVNIPQNSQFALAIIQTLLANKGASAFQSIEYVNL